MSIRPHQTQRAIQLSVQTYNYLKLTSEMLLLVVLSVYTIKPLWMVQNVSFYQTAWDIYQSCAH